MRRYPDDPAGVLRSVAHRMVLGHLPVPGAEPAWPRVLLPARLFPLFGEASEVFEIAEDLIAEGLAEDHGEAGMRQTAEGYAALTGPARSPGVSGPATIAAVEPLEPLEPVGEPER